MSCAVGTLEKKYNFFKELRKGKKLEMTGKLRKVFYETEIEFCLD